MEGKGVHKGESDSDRFFSDLGRFLSIRTIISLPSRTIWDDGLVENPDDLGSATI